MSQTQKLPPLPEHGALAPQLSGWKSERASSHDSLPHDALPPLSCTAAATLPVASPLYC